MPKIVLTGGPGAGKSVVSAAIAARWPVRVACVAESATHVYASLGTRWDKLDLEGRRRVQRMIYHNQIEQEQRLTAQHDVPGGKLLLLDRGTVDGAAYWPEGPAAYWADLGSTIDAELARYDAVIWLETAAALGIYDGDASNPVRFESPAAAVESGRLLKTLWGGHAHLHHVGAFVSIDDKIEAVCEILRPFLGTVER